MDRWRPVVIHMDAEMLLERVRGRTRQGIQCTSKERLPPKWVCPRPAGRIDWGYLEVATVQSFKDEDLWWPVDERGHVLAGAAEKAYPELNAAGEQKDDQRAGQRRAVRGASGADGRASSEEEQEQEEMRKCERTPTPPGQPRAAAERAPACRRVRKTQ